MPKIKIFIKDKEIFFKKLQYMASNNLNWHVESKPEWATVTPSAGTGDESGVTVSVIPASSSTEGINGEIVIESDNGQQVKILVERCVRCVCYSATSATTITAASYSSTTATVTWKYRERGVNGEYGAEQTSSTTVTFSGNTSTASSVTRSGSLVWSDHRVCNEDECGDEISIDWKVVVPKRTPIPCRCEYNFVPTKEIYNIPCSGDSAFTVSFNQIYDRSNNCDPDNQCKNESGFSTTFSFPCNSGNSITSSTTKNISEKTLTINYKQSGNCDCGQCTYTCADFLGATAHTIPSNPTGNVLIFSYDVSNDKSKGDKEVGIGAVWYYRNSQIFRDASDNDWHIESAVTSNKVHRDVYLPSSLIKANTDTSVREEDFYIIPYHCSDTQYSGGSSIPSSEVCDTETIRIKQSAAEQTCNVTDISVANRSIELTGSSFSNKVTVSSNGNACTNKWYGYNVATPDVIVTGNSGSNYTGTTTGTYRVHSEDDPTKTADFTVTSPFTVKAKSGTPPGNGTITLSYTGTTISSWTDASAANWQTMETPRSIRLDGTFVCAEIIGLTLDLSLGTGTTYSTSNISVEGQPQTSTPYTYGHTHLTIVTNGGCVINKVDDANCDNNDYYASYTLTLSNGATIDVEIHLKPNRANG